ncbi:MAG: GGDEF domain-containing protein [Pseudomonadota bacterium]|nr:GGDEF domain-containing protein [Magnetococcales bacterium]MEC8067067.1 GGDEF domain-containing protein [Pseudomonadota bacterium]MEC8467677.1 GGDEF domain-containing protein [Pseudomonadota bacterium]|tara:strand:+ start:44199 stop:44846 length:648 start_codon:yes stop_codon:yes gene_type:complete
MFKSRQKDRKRKMLTSLNDFRNFDEQDPAFVQMLMSQVMELEVKVRDQQSLIETLEKDAMTDALTNLSNRRVFEEELKKSLAFVRRYKRRSALMFVDIDAFKSINDQFGHLAGDHALKLIADILKQNTRPTDIVARLGGDEFAIILNEVDGQYDVANRARELESLIARTPLVFDHNSIHLTASIGTKSFGAGDTYESVVDGADHKMYENKRNHNS